MHPDPIAPLVPLTDLRKITRDSKSCLSRVRLQETWSSTIDWLIFGQAQLTTVRDRADGRWVLKAYLKEGVTDFEHDSAYALQLPLIGVILDHVYYQETSLVAWVDPNDAEGFHVPPPGYNPMVHPDSHKCTGDYKCDASKSKPHIIVPEGLYVPPSDKGLYSKVRGKRVEITLGPV